MRGERPAPIAHGLPYPPDGKRHSDFSGQRLLAMGRLQHLFGTMAYPLGDGLQGRRFAHPPVLHRGADYAAGVGDKVGEAEHALLGDGFQGELCRALIWLKLVHGNSHTTFFKLLKIRHKTSSLESPPFWV